MAEASDSAAGHHGRHGSLIVVSTLALLGAAIVKELRTPAAKRQWHGKLGPVPYDLRVPTVARAQARFLDPKGPLFPPNLFGIGWTVNVSRLVALVRAKLHH
jgi:hypothetical protein